MPAVAAELLLQSVVGPRQIRVREAMEKPRPVAVRDLEEMADRPSQSAGTPLIAGHRPQEAGKPSPHFDATGFAAVVQNACRSMYPGESGLHVRPQRRRFLEPAIDETFQAVEFFREPLFSATRSRLREMAVRR